MTVLSELSKLSEFSKCTNAKCLIVATENGVDNDDYLQRVSQGGLTKPSITLRDFFSKPLALLTILHQQ